MKQGLWIAQPLLVIVLIGSDRPVNVQVCKKVENKMLSGPSIPLLLAMYGHVIQRYLLVKPWRTADPVWHRRNVHGALRKTSVLLSLILFSSTVGGQYLIRLAPKSLF